MYNRVARILRPFGPLAVTVLVLSAGLLVLSLFRIALAAVYWDRISTTPDFLWIFPVGFRMDVILCSYLAILPTLLILVMPKSAAWRLRRLIAGWTALALGFVLYMEIATFPFMDEYDLRPDGKFIEYLKHVQEVFGTLLAAYKYQMLFALLALILWARFIWKVSLATLTEYSAWNARIRLIALPIVLALLVLGARSSLGHRPANISTAAFSNNHLVNELSLNSGYTLLNAIYRRTKHEKNPSALYGKMDREEVLSRVSNLIRNDGVEVGAREPIPFLKTQRSPFKRTRPLNVVIILEESLGAPHVGCLGGQPLTPELCKLRDQGMWLSNLYATGTRTARGIEAVFSGFLPTASSGVIKLEKARKDFFTIADLLKQHGYRTQFHYGGVSTFDEMRAFCLANGVDEIYDQETFKNPEFVSTWGVSDEDLFRRANEIFESKQDKPFFALLLTTSNHSPFEFRDGAIDLYNQPKATRENAAKYSDFALGRFFELARKSSYYENTIFAVLADHNANVRGNDLVPLDHFRIPGLIIGPDVPARDFQTLSSQIDLAPTLLHFIGIDVEHPMVGRNLAALTPQMQGRAFMQFADNNAYQHGSQVIIQRPLLPPLQFTRNAEVLEPTTLNPEMAKDALAYAHLPWIVYSEKKYRLPATDKLP